MDKALHMPMWLEIKREDGEWIFTDENKCSLPADHCKVEILPPP